MTRVEKGGSCLVMSGVDDGAARSEARRCTVSGINFPIDVIFSH